MFSINFINYFNELFCLTVIHRNKKKRNNIGIECFDALQRIDFYHLKIHDIHGSDRGGFGCIFLITASQIQ